MLCSIYDIQIYKNDMLICTTDYITKQDIISINLTTKEEKTIFSINLKDNWIITSFQRNNNGLYIGNINMENSQVGKTIYYDFNTKKIQETSSNVLYGRTPFINDNMLFHNLEKWSIYNSTKNQFYNIEVIGEYKDEYIYPTFYILNNNKILVKGAKNQFYIGTLNI